MNKCQLCHNDIEPRELSGPAKGVSVFVPDGGIFMDTDEYKFHESCLTLEYDGFTPMDLIKVLGFNTEDTK